MRVLRKIQTRLGGERGWVLIEAVMSAVVVILGFTAATVAFNSGNRTAARDVDRSGAVGVAQSQIELMRQVGGKDIPTLLAMNNTTKTVTSGGTQYTIAYTANYTDSLGGTNSDACGSFATGGSNGAAYVYMNVSVTWPGMVGYSSGTQPVTLTSYFAPEGGSSQAKTATLKVYVLDKDGNPLSGSPQVSLRTGGGTGPVVKGPTTVNSNGCVLFTGLGSDTYTLTIPPPVNGYQDMYNRVDKTTKVYTKDVDVPARGAIVQKVQLAPAITVAPVFLTYLTSTAISTGPSAGTTITPANSNIFVNDTLGGNSGKGLWVAESSDITTAVSPDYTLNPGKVFMPHYNNTVFPTTMYPDAGGYSAFAGGCDINNPGGQGSSTSLTTIATAGNSTPTLWLGQLANTMSLPNGVAAATQAAKSTTYYYAQKLSSFTVRARLIGDDNATNTETTPDCGSRTSLYNTWQTLGTLNYTSGITGAVSLSDDLEAVPPGQYDLCVIANYTYSWGTTTTTLSGGKYTWASGSPKTNVAATDYMSYPGQIVGYQKVPVAHTDDFTSISNSAPGPNNTASCGS